MIRLESNNDPPTYGVDILDNDSDSDVYFPKPVAESDGDDSVTVGNGSNTLTSPVPTVPSEVVRRGHGLAKEYPPSIWESFADGNILKIGIDADKIERLVSLCPTMYPLTCGTN